MTDNKEKKNETELNDNNIAKETEITKDSQLISEIEAMIDKLETDSSAKKLIKEFDKKIKDFSLKELLVANKKMLLEVEQANKERDEYLSILQRFKADFENYKKRAQKQEINNVRYSSEKVLSKIFEPIEDIDRALKFAEESNLETVPFEGISIIHGKLLRVLEDEGVTLINPKKGNTFDPYYHEAISIDPSGNHEPGLVVKLFEKGYKIKDRVVRAAKVMVSTEQETAKE